MLKLNFSRFLKKERLILKMGTEHKIYLILEYKFIVSVVLSEVLATDPEFPVSIPGPTRFSEK
jgi:hypothetical protein